MNSATRTISTIDEFLSTVGGGTKQAEDSKDPGSIGGPTAHPIKNVDNNTIAPVEGEQSADNHSRVKDDVGAASVDSRPDAKAASLDETIARLAIGRQKKAEGGAVSVTGSAADDHQEATLNPQPTGQAPSVETASVKAKKDDPGSEHPARTDNDELNGGKYAFDANTPYEKTAAMMSEVGDSLCAMFHFITNNEPEPVKRAAAADAPVLDPYVAQQAGWELAGLLNGTMDKRAADTMVVSEVADIIKEASDKAEHVIDYMNGYKSANDPMDPAAMGGAPGGAPPMGGPPAPPGGGGGGGEEAALMDAMGGGEAPPDAGGGGGDDAEAEILAKALEICNVDPQEFQAALEAAQGGGGGAPPGGAPPMDPAAGGGAPPMPGGGGGPPPPPGGMEVAASDRRQTAAQKTASENRLKELLIRSRSPKR